MFIHVKQIRRIQQTARRHGLRVDRVSRANLTICIGGVRVAPAGAPEDCWMHFATVVERVRSDFTEMPCLELTLAQAIRLWHVGADDCRFVLDALVEEGFLQWTAQRTIVRADHNSYINAPDLSLSHIPVRRINGPGRRA